MLAEKGSFRDPAGHIFYNEGAVFRQINESFVPHYEKLMETGLYDELVREGLLIPHEMVQASPLIIKPEKLSFVSYPHEWSFSQLKDAALVTLKVQKAALKHGMSLKDASVYNIQFHRGRPVFIDTLSLAPKNSSLPWGAYKQFCQHFLAPLALQGCVDWRLKDLFLTHIDGVPLDLAQKLLGRRCFYKLGLIIHLYMHSKFQASGATQKATSESGNSSPLAATALVASLESAINAISWKLPKTMWQDYYQDDSYSPPAFTHKGELVENLLKELKPKVVWDFGCNDGFYSLMARRHSHVVVSFDTDPVCIDRFYHKHTDILPLLMNLSNPTPSFGWAGQERMSLANRGPADLIMALAVMHHLHVSAGIPLGQMGEYLSKLCSNLLIEFIPKEDHKFKKMTIVHQSDFQNYGEEVFLNAFSRYFHLVSRQPIHDSKRVLFLFKTKKD